MLFKFRFLAVFLPFLQGERVSSYFCQFFYYILEFSVIPINHVFKLVLYLIAAFLLYIRISLI